jgi:hypothetical protein
MALKSSYIARTGLSIASEVFKTSLTPVAAPARLMGMI